MLLGALACVACYGGGSGGDGESSARTVPADVEPEDASFKYAVRNGNENVLTVRLSKISHCSKAAVPDGQEFVRVDVIVSLSETIGPGTYEIGEPERAEVSLQRTSGDACSGASGSGASTGFVRLDEVTPTTVRGSFVGTNADTRLELRGSFVANACSGDPSDTCL
jgi:hypothetical protein